MRVRGVLLGVLVATMAVPAAAGGPASVRTVVVERGPIPAIAASGVQLAWLRGSGRGRVAVQNVRTGKRVLVPRRVQDFDTGLALDSVWSLAFGHGRLLYVLWSAGGNTGSSFYIVTSGLRRPRERVLYYTTPNDRPYPVNDFGQEDPGPWPLASDGWSIVYRAGLKTYLLGERKSIRLRPAFPTNLFALGGGRYGGAWVRSYGGCICNFRPTWSPDGSSIAYESDEPFCCFDASPPSTRIRIASGGSSRVLAKGQDPDWAPRGDALAFYRKVKSGSSVYVVRSDGSGLTRLAAGAHPDWAPDGDVIAFDRAVSGTSSIYVIRPDGTGLRRLVSGSLPVWSPDGSRIAFSRSGTLYVASSDGTGARPLNSGVYATDPSWSPDGRRLAFAAENELYVVDADGSAAPRRIAAGETWQKVERPSWSPDGQEIAFSELEIDEYLEKLVSGRIWLVRPDGTGLHTFARGRLAADPAWSPLGDRLAYAGWLPRREPFTDLPSTEIFASARSPEGALETRLTTTHPREPTGVAAIRPLRGGRGVTVAYVGGPHDIALTPSFAAVLVEGYFGKRILLFDPRTARLRRSVSVPDETGPVISARRGEVAYSVGTELRVLHVATGTSSTVARAGRAPSDLVLFAGGLAWTENTSTRGVLRISLEPRRSRAPSSTRSPR